MLIHSCDNARSKNIIFGNNESKKFQLLRIWEYFFFFFLSEKENWLPNMFSVIIFKIIEQKQKIKYKNSAK